MASAPAIRPARAGEAAVLAAIIDAAYRHYIPRIGKPPGPMSDDYAARIAAGQAWVLEDDGQAAGILVLEDQPDALLLDNVAILPDRQGRGLGGLLIRFAQTEARRRGHDLLRLYTHVLMTENIALYKRFGFDENARIAEKGFDRVYMTKFLGP